MRRFGAPAVTLGFLTVGVQTAINASAGMLRMPQRRFLPAVALGAALWSVLYTTVGFTVVDAWLGRLSWWWAVVAVGGRRRQRARVPSPRATGTADAPARAARRPSDDSSRLEVTPALDGQVVTSWAAPSTCWHLPIMESRPRDVPEAPPARRDGPAHLGTGIRADRR